MYLPVSFLFFSGFSLFVRSLTMEVDHPTHDFLDGVYMIHLEQLFWPFAFSVPSDCSLILTNYNSIPGSISTPVCVQSLYAQLFVILFFNVIPVHCGLFPYLSIGCVRVFLHPLNYSSSISHRDPYASFIKCPSSSFNLKSSIDHFRYSPSSLLLTRNT